VAQVTICIPAYRSSRFIGQTLESIRVQTFRDFRVEIAVEPDDADGVVMACVPFLDDRRFHLRRNSTRVGWGPNIRALLARVETPYYMVQPHDDMLHPEYLERLLMPLVERPDAVLAYGDLYVFGTDNGLVTLPLPDAGLAERLLAFFLAGAEGTPWHGVARSATLRREYPTNAWNSFAVECEWSLHLAASGGTLHVPVPLYFKRALRSENVSWRWLMAMSADERVGALENYRLQMLRGIPSSGLSSLERRSVELAAHAANLRRWVQFTDGRFPMTAQQLDAAEQLTRDAADPNLLRGDAIRASSLLALARYWQSLNDLERAHALARAAVEACPDFGDAWLQLGSVTLALGEIHETAHIIVAARQHGADELRAGRLAADYGRRLKARYPWPDP
jgi:Glycosyl transferase family 2